MKTRQKRFRKTIQKNRSLTHQNQQIQKTASRMMLKLSQSARSHSLQIIRLAIPCIWKILPMKLRKSTYMMCSCVTRRKDTLSSAWKAKTVFMICCSVIHVTQSSLHQIQKSQFPRIQKSCRIHLTHQKYLLLYPVIL